MAIDRILERLLKLHPKLIDLSLSRLKKLLGRLGNPEENLPPVIHVAGTNGKGSTVATMAAIYRSAGYRVHIYTSPHLVSFTERIVISGSEISKNYLEELLLECENANNGENITFFEITTLAAILIFDNHNIDIAILEVGLGGRLDAVNAFEPNISVITSIGLDHTEYLGDTLEKIAVEKSGVMRATKPCVIGEENCIDILKKQASELNSIPYFFNKDFDSRVIPFDKSNLTYVQQKNLSCAIFSLQQLGLTKLTSNLKEELLQQNFFGRFNRISTTPEVIIDVAHNLDSVKNLVRSLIKLGNKKTYFVFSLLKDKDLSLIIQLFDGYFYECCR